jgi:hypothetical protein
MPPGIRLVVGLTPPVAQMVFLHKSIRSADARSWTSGGKLCPPTLCIGASDPRTRALDLRMLSIFRVIVVDAAVVVTEDSLLVMRAQNGTA